VSNVTARTPSSQRLIGIDAARGVALVGMIVVHVLPSVGPGGDLTTGYLLFSGRSSALFAVLAGVSLALASGVRTPPRGRDWLNAAVGVWARAAVIGAVGLMLGVLDSGIAVILAYYGLLFALGAFFLPLRPPLLFTLGAVWIVVGPILSQWLRPELPDPSLMVPNPLFLAQPIQGLLELGLTGYYPAVTWLGYLLVGLAVGRSDLTRRAVQLSLAGVGIVVAVAAKLVSSMLLDAGGMEQIMRAGAGTHPLVEGSIEISLQSSLYGTTPTTTWWWLATSGPHSGTPFDFAHTTGTAIATIGIALLIARSVIGSGVMWPIAAAGSMTFTLYTLHVVLRAGLIGGETMTDVWVHVLIAVVLGVVWRALLPRGPLEALARNASHGARAIVTGPDPASRG